MNIEKLPQEDRKRIKAHEAKIGELNSAELLDYSKALQRQKSLIGVNVCNYLFEAIDARTKQLNTQSIKVVQCRDRDMVKQFQKDSKCKS